MRVPSSVRRGSHEFNMTPMIDVTFLLIVFFLVSSHLARQEVQYELSLPAAESGRPQREDDTRRVTVNVLSEAELRLGSRLVSHVELAQAIAYESKQPGPPLEVRIRCDRGVPYRVVEPIMLACAQGGVWNVTFAVFRKH